MPSKDISKLVANAPDIATAIAKLIAAERERSGMTTEQIMDKAQQKLDENEARLKADLDALEKKKNKPNT